MTHAVTAMPAMSGIWNSSDSPIAPPRNSARSVAIAAISLTTHIAHTNGRGKQIAAQFCKVPSGDDAELGGQRLEQHGDQVGGDHDPEEIVAVFRAGLDVGGVIARVHVGDRGDHRGAGKREPCHSAAAPASEHVPRRCDSARGQVALGQVGLGRLATSCADRCRSFPHSSPASTLKCSLCYMWVQYA